MLQQKKSSDAQQGSSSFVLADNELDSLSSATVTYFTSCASENDANSRLTVFLNNNPLFSGVPDCNTVARFEVDPANLLTGRNSLSFFTTSGSYLLDRIVVTTTVEESLPASYFFQLDEDEYNNITSGRDEIILYFSFLDDDRRKNAELNVNNEKFSLDTKKKSLSRKIPISALREGANAVTITPLRTFVISLFEVRLS